MILLFGYTSDGHLSLLEKRSTELDINYIRVNLDRPTDDLGLTINTSNWPPVTIGKSREPVTGIFNRWSSPIKFDLSDYPPDTRRFVADEYHDYIFGGLSLLPSVVWMNTIQASYASTLKLAQLSLAQKHGLQIPTTVISKKKAVLTVFWHRQGGDVVTKAIRKGHVSSTGGKHQVLFTNTVSKQNLDKLKENNDIPILLQAKVKKAYELRVVVIGQEVFVSKIDHDDLIDWRTRSMQDLKTAVYTELPDQIKNACIEIVREMGLTFGVIDIIRDTNGQYIFLEVNQQGGWLWMEKTLKLPISAKILDILSSGYNDQS